MRLSPVILVALCACGGGKESAPAGAETTPATQAAPAAGEQVSTTAQGTGMGLCPLVQAGAKLSAAELPGGAALAVEITAERRDWVRSYLRDMTRKREERRNAPGGTAHRERLPAHATSVEDTESGARMVFRPVNAGDLPALVAGVRDNATRLPVACGAAAH